MLSPDKNPVRILGPASEPMTVRQFCKEHVAHIVYVIVVGATLGIVWYMAGVK